MTRLGPTKKTPYAVLSCPNRYCDNISAPIYLIEEKIISFLTVWLNDYELNVEKKEAPLVSATYKASGDALEKELETLKAQLNKTYDLLERGIYDDETFLQRNETIKNKMDECSKALENIKELAAAEEQALSIENNFIPTVKSIVEGYSAIEDASMKNELLKAVIKRIEYVKETRNTRGKRDIDNFDLTVFPLIPYK